DQVRAAVAVEVTGRHADITATAALEDGGAPEAAIAVTREHVHGPREIEPTHGEVELPIAVEITHRRVVECLAQNLGGGGLEGAAPVPEQDRLGNAAAVAAENLLDNDVGVAVAVEVAHPQRLGAVRNGEGLFLPEGAIPVAPEHGHVEGAGVRRYLVPHHQTDLAVPQIDGRHALGDVRGQVPGRREG